MITRYDVGMQTRDGVRLSNDIYLPDDKGPHPVILQRTPYNNNGSWVVAEAHFYVSLGYAYVAQDCRGKYDSDGEWYPYRHETEDGDDALTWCGTQPWSSGKVGMIGASYSGTVQWFAAATGNPYLKCIQPSVAFSDLFFDHGLRRGGVLQPYFFSWLVTTAGRTLFEIDKDRRDRALMHVPVSDMDEFLGFDLKFWKDFAGRDEYDDFWKQFSVRHRYHAIDVPSLSVACWHSPWELQGALTNFAGVTRHAPSADTRARQRLIVGPWTHFVNVSPLVGEHDFGPQAVIDLHKITTRWFARWLKDEPAGDEPDPPVRIFVMGRNKWRDETAWPLPDAVPTAFYLHSGGRANTIDGNGSLDRERPSSDEPADRYVYNPERPIRLPLSDTTPEDHLYADRRTIERRDDVLVYSTEPLAEDVEVTGPVTATLFASTSAPDTDIVATLVDVSADGFAKPLTWGIARGRYLAGVEKPALLEPNRVYEWTIDLWATSHVFLEGHRIRLDVTSSFFPFFGRNHNTGHDVATDVAFALAEQTIHHSSERPSHVLLPLVVRPVRLKPDTTPS